MERVTDGNDFEKRVQGVPASQCLSGLRDFVLAGSESADLLFVIDYGVHVFVEPY